ncbi:MAG TPA: glycosyltransferase, partial [Gemmata sp.]|nr:glycosyltransferase [Gemmata sp.]
MPERTERRVRRNPHGELIHLLNQRYHAEWVRAELLQNELDGLRRSRAGRLIAWIKRLKERLRPSRPIPEPEITEQAVPYVPSTDLPPPAGRVSIVIPFRDQPELLRNCLRSLRSTTYRDFEAVLVDNGS